MPRESVHIFAALIVAALIAASGLACSESQPPPAPSPDWASTPTAPAPAEPRTAAPGTAPSAAAPFRAPVHPPAAPSDASAPALRCGDPPLAPCPLYAWMKEHTSPAMTAHDFEALAAALDEVASFAPPSYANWASIARDGASAARVEEIDAVRAACRGCHNQYKEKYKRDMRDRAL